jgi:membrane fusion protein
MTVSITSSMFRHEVLAERQAPWLGSIRVARPLSFSAVTAVAVACVALVVGFAIWGEVTRKASLAGVLLPTGGLVLVTAPQAGTLAEWKVIEGRSVRRGEALARIASERHTAGGDVGEQLRAAQARRLNSLEAERQLLLQRDQLDRRALDQRVRSLEQMLHHTRHEAELAERRAALAQAALNRFRELASAKVVTQLQLQQREEEHLDLLARAAATRRQLELQRQEQASLATERETRRTQLQTALLQIDRALAAAEQERIEHDARSGSVVVSPADGRLVAVLQQPGQPVVPGQNLASLVPDDGPPAAGDSALDAVLFAPSRTAGFVRPGQRVRIRYAAYPFQKFGMAGGEVVQVGGVPVAPQDLPAGMAQAIVAAAGSTEPLRRITVRLDRQTVEAHGQTHRLTPGQTLEADVALETRKVWEWLLEPWLAARQRAGPFPSATAVPDGGPTGPRDTAVRSVPAHPGEQPGSD